MPDFGLTEALGRALEASKAVRVMRPAEAKLAGAAATTAPEATAPAVPGVERPVARAPSVTAPPAEQPPGAPQAAPINPSQPPVDVPAPSPADAADTPQATPAGPDVAPGAGDAAPPTGAVAASEEPAQAPAAPVPADSVAPGNKVPAQAISPDVQQSAERFVQANLKDFEGKLNMSHMPNVDTMSTPDGVKAAILQVADDNKEAITAARRGVVTDEQLTGLAQDLALNGDILKQVMSREFGTSLERPEVILAARMVEQQQMGNLLGLAAKVADGSATAEELVRFQQTAELISNYRTQLSGAVAEQGRGLRAMSIPVGLPTGVMDHISEVLRQNNPNMQATAQAIKLAGSPAGIANIVSGMSTLPVWRRGLMASWGLLQRIYINGILSGPPTWAKIFLGNNLNLGLNTFDLYAAGIGRGMAGLAARLGGWPTASEGATISDAVAHMHGVISGGADALRVGGRILKTGVSLDGIMRAGEGATGAAKGTTLEALPELQDTWFGSITRAIDTAIDAPGGRVIGGIDEFTKTLGYRAYVTMMSLKEVRSQIVAGTLRAGEAEATMTSLMQNPSPEMQQAGEEWAHRMTFQSPFPEGGAGEAFQNVLNKAPVLRFIFPFMRTATNIFKQSLVERTPFALFSARIRNQLAAGGMEADLAKSRIATGTAIGSMFAWMAIHDRITGDAPKDAKERMEWQLDGRRPYSIRMTDPVTGKDTWRDYSWWEPMATVAGAVSDAVALQSYIHSNDDVDTMMDHENRLNDAISHVMASVIQNTGNKTFMQGAAQFSEMYNDPQRAFGMWADQMGAAMVPFSGATKFVRNEQDPFMRQAFTLMDKIRDELPTFFGVKGSQSLPARLDVFGQARARTNGNAILGPLNPLPGTASTKDDVTDEVQRVMEQTRKVPITMPSKQLALLENGAGMQDGQGMRLTPQEYNDYTRLARAEPVFDGGKLTFREKLAQTIASPVYKAATDPVRETLLEHVQNAADRIGRERLFRENTDFAERMTAWTAEVNRLKYNK